MITASKRNPQEETTKSSLTKGDSIQNKQPEQERTLALLHSSNHLSDVVQHIQSNGFIVVMQKDIQFTLDQAKEFYADHINQNYYDKMLKWLSSSTITALVLEKQDAVKEWRQLMGPANYKKARKANPNSIRALFGKDTSQNATHGSDSDVSACKEIDFIFKEGASFLVDTTHNEVRMNTIENETIANDTKKETEQSQNITENDFIQNGDKNSEKQDDTIHVPEAMTSTPSVVSEVHTENDKRDDETPSVDVQNDAEVISQDQSPAVITLVKENIDTDQSNREETVAVADEETVSTDSIEGTSANKDGLKEQINPSVATTQDEASMEEERTECHLEATKTEEQEESAQTKVDTDNEKQVESTAEIKETESVTPAKENKEKSVISATKNENETHTGEEEIGVDSVIECNDTQEKEESISTALESKEETSNDSHIGEAKESGDQIGKEKEVVIEDMKVEQEESIQKKEPISVKKNIATTDKKTLKKPKESIAVSTSRIRPPSVKGQISETVRNHPPSKVASRPASIKSGTGTTRIARLSPSATINKETEIKKPEPSRESASPSVAKKAVTKVSKNLPRVAKMPTPKPTETKENEEVEKKPKKRLSSTKSFISRLTTPTVASANKKAEADAPVTSSVPKRSSLPSKRTSTVGPAVSTSKVMQRKNTTVTNGMKQKQATTEDSTKPIPN